MRFKTKYSFWGPTPFWRYIKKFQFNKISFTTTNNGHLANWNGSVCAGFNQNIYCSNSQRWMLNVASNRWFSFASLIALEQHSIYTSHSTIAQYQTRTMVHCQSFNGLQLYRDSSAMIFSFLSIPFEVEMRCKYDIKKQTTIPTACSPLASNHLAYFWRTPVITFASLFMWLQPKLLVFAAMNTTT